MVTDTDCDCGNLIYLNVSTTFLGNSFDYGIIHFIIIVAATDEKLCQRIKIMIRNYVTKFIDVLYT